MLCNIFASIADVDVEKLPIEIGGGEGSTGDGCDSFDGDGGGEGSVPSQYSSI